MSNKVFSGDFLKVLLALKESIMKDIHCSELAIIKEVYTNNCNCSLLSNPEIKINAYKTKGTICRVGDIVLVAFSDNDFRSNLLKKDNDSQLQVIDSPIKHQLDYGIIISNLTIGAGGTNVKFVDDAINTTNLSNLDLNRLSEQKLNELKDSGLLTKNSLYMTPDISEDETKANVDGSNLTDENIASWANKFFPVGSIYMSVDSTSPASFLGGTWEQILGKFLLSSDDVLTDETITTAGNYHIGDNGGSADAVVVAHNHSYKAVTTLSTSHTHNNFQNHQIAVAPDNVYWEGPYENGIVPTGVDGTGKNMPPYLVVYMWKRTA